MSLKGLAPLALRPYRRLLLAYAINALGGWVGELALALLVLRETGSPAAVAAVWVLGQFVPSLTGPVLVARLGRVRPDRALPCLLALQATLFVAQAVAATSFALPLLLLIATIDGIAGVPARALIKTSMVAVAGPAGLLHEANTLLGGVFTTCAAVGPFLAGGLVAWVTPQSALFVGAAALALAAVVLGLGSRLPFAGAPGEQTVGAQIRAGFAHVRGEPVLKHLVSAYGGVCLFGAAVLPVEVVFVTHSLHGSEADYGLVLTLWGVGAMAGSALVPALRRVPLNWLVVGSFVLVGISYLGMGLAASIPVLCGFSLLGGIGNGVEAFATLTAIQERAGAAVQAQVNGMVESIAAGAIGLGFLLGGAVATVASPRAVYLLAAAGILLAGAALTAAVVDPRHRVGRRWAGRTSPGVLVRALALDRD